MTIALTEPAAEARPDEPADDLVDVLQTLQEQTCDWALAHDWSKEKLREFIGRIHAELGYAVDLAIAVKDFGGRDA